MEISAGLTGPGQPFKMLPNPAHSPGPHFSRPGAVFIILGQAISPCPRTVTAGQLPTLHTPALLSCASTESGSPASLSQPMLSPFPGKCPMSRAGAGPAVPSCPCHQGTAHPPPVKESCGSQGLTPRSHWPSRHPHDPVSSNSGEDRGRSCLQSSCFHYQD